MIKYYIASGVGGPKLQKKTYMLYMYSSFKDTLQFIFHRPSIHRTLPGVFRSSVVGIYRIWRIEHFSCTYLNQINKTHSTQPYLVVHCHLQITCLCSLQQRNDKQENVELVRI